MWSRAPFENHPFQDRRDAGQRLSSKLSGYADENPIVLGLARGGVVVAAEVAKELDAELDVLAARKIGAPMQPELGIGAVAPGGVRFIDQERVDQLGITDQEVEKIAALELAELDRRMHAYRGVRPPLNLEDRTVIVVDDGLATGVTARAALRYVKAKGARRVILAVPVCASQSADELRHETDEVVCSIETSNLMAVGYWYQDFSQTENEEVLRILHEAHRE